MKNIFLVCTLVSLFSFSAFSQKDKKKGALSDINIDSLSFLSTAGNSACKCIDSIKMNALSTDETPQAITDCIDRQTGPYQLGLKLFNSMNNVGDKNITIDYNTNKTSNEYKRYYFQIENWLMDSCKSLKTLIATNNKESEFSFSKNEKALKEYNDGITYFDNENYSVALPYFERAVKIDPKFAFAWDNIGVCNRRLDNLDKALYAYNKSLEVDPKGHTPLQNIPVVYEFQKEYDKALKAYANMIAVYPDDAECFYGAGRIYLLYKEDYEKGLQNMCKAYNIYTKSSSPFRVDAEKNIQYIYSKMKEAGKEAKFDSILKENNISTQ